MKRFALLGLCLLLFLVGCTGSGEITGTPKQEVLAYTEPMVDNLLEGFNEGNYAKFSRDFDENMRNALTEAVFSQNRGLVVSKIGLYVSRETPQVRKENAFIIAVYNAEFEGEKGVEVKVVFLKYADRNLVSGLWFNSPKLRE